ncbi:MAG: cupredoxin domain-containing protein [Halobacteriota archaeon]
MNLKTGRGQNVKKHLLLLTLALIIAPLVIAGCSSSSSQSQISTASQNSIAIKNDAFNPSSITISKGATVTWTNEELEMHTVTSDTGAFDSGNLNHGDSYSHQFNDAGTFPYHCSPHHFMKGTITVQ